MTEELYQKKLDLFRQLRKLTEEIGGLTAEQLVNEDQAHERLLKLLGEREGLMEQIDRLDLQLAECGEEEAAQAVQDALRGEMLQIQEHNARVENALQSGLAQLRQEAKRIKEGRQSQRAYFGGSSAEGAFIDTKR
ncbi:hypothetical protein [Candidatus Darwinibacter acetoxidans]